MVETIILSIEITWIYNKTNGSLLFPVLIHGIDNTYGVVLGTSGSKPMLAYIVVIVIAFFIVIDMCRKKLKGGMEI